MEFLTFKGHLRGISAAPFGKSFVGIVDSFLLRFQKLLDSLQNCFSLQGFANMYCCFWRRWLASRGFLLASRIYLAIRIQAGSPAGCGAVGHVSSFSRGRVRQLLQASKAGLDKVASNFRKLAGARVDGPPDSSGDFSQLVHQPDAKLVSMSSR